MLEKCYDCVALSSVGCVGLVTVCGWVGLCRCMMEMVVGCLRTPMGRLVSGVREMMEGSVWRIDEGGRIITALSDY